MEEPSVDSEGDTEYRHFCRHLYSSDANEFFTDEGNDPPYIFNDHILSPGWRFDLDEELHQQQDDADALEATYNQNQQSQQPNQYQQHDDTSKSPCKYERRKISIFEELEFKRVLNQQLRQHIQLLTQTYLLTKNTTNMQDEANEAKDYLSKYMKVFKNKPKPSNLLPAIELVNSFGTSRDIKSYIRLSWRHLPIPESVRKILDTRRDIFMYANLMPEVAFSLLPEKLLAKKPKINFTPNEDKLLAYALNEFKRETSQYAYIASLLMAAKTKMQINNHIKNIKRSPGNEDHPVKLFYSKGQLPIVDLDADAELREHMTSLDLDDLMAASTTISKAVIPITQNMNEKTARNLKLRSSMLELMSRPFNMTQEMGELIIDEFITASKDKLSERNHLHLLQLLTDLMRKESATETDSAVNVYNEISRFLAKIEAPPEFQERLVLFLDLDQATKCGCAINYLHWIQFFEFIYHVELHHEGEAIEKKLSRLIDALQKDDSHKVKLAAAHLINKHPLLKREFDALDLGSKPHSSLFLSQEDFDDITEPLAAFQSRKAVIDKNSDLFDKEYFELKPTTDEVNFASPSCPCNCHHHADYKQQVTPIAGGEHQAGNHELGQHCNRCNLKFMKGRMYLVNKIKPNLAEWSYVTTPPPSLEASTSSSSALQANSQSQAHMQPATTSDQHPSAPQWTFEEDKEILEFCRAKAELNDENISFDTTTFEELVNKRRNSTGPADGEHDDKRSCKKSAREIAERFNQLMEMYRVESS